MTTLSPFARKCRAAVIELGLEEQVELVPLPPRAPTDSKPDLEALNPLSKIPVLETAEGSIVDSRVIVPYLNALAGGLLYAETAAGWHDRVLEALADGICDAGVVVRLEMVRPESEQRPVEIAAYRGKIERTLNHLEANPPEGDRFHAGIIALVSAIDWLRFRNILPDPLGGRPRLAAVHAYWSDRRCLRETRPA